MMAEAFITLITLSILATSAFQQVTYDSQTAFEMVRASSAAYCSNDELQGMNCGDICDDLQGYQFIRQYSYDIDDLQSVSYSMFFDQDLEVVVVAFRGTKGKDQLISELLNAVAVSYTLYDIKNSVATGFFYNAYKNFLRDDFLSSLQSAINDYPDYAFNFVGHSLGGAFANLAVLDAAYGGYLPKERINLYTYGSPRVGDFNLAQAVVNSASIINRVVHYKDIVPHLPPCQKDFLFYCVADPNHPSEDGVLMFHAWHIWPEVFYTSEDSQDYIICDSGEDKTCSDKFALVSGLISDHLLYFGKTTKCLQNSPIESMF